MTALDSGIKRTGGTVKVIRYAAIGLMSFVEQWRGDLRTVESMWPGVKTNPAEVSVNRGSASH